MNLQTVNELTHLYVTLNPFLAANKNGKPEVKETPPTFLHKKANLDELITWRENLLIRIGSVTAYLKRAIKKQGELNEQKNSAS